jgi:hypothetical protein
MGALLSRYAELDVRRAVNRRVPGCVVVLFDFGPQPPKVVGVPAQADAKRMRKYEVDRAEWERETGGKPIELGLNSVDATEALRDGSRWRTSATAPAVVAEPRSVGPVVINLVDQAGGGAAFGGFWVQDVFSLTKYVLFSVDYTEVLSRGGGQYIPTTPSPPST